MDIRCRKNLEIKFLIYHYLSFSKELTQQKTIDEFSEYPDKVM